MASYTKKVKASVLIEMESDEFALRAVFSDEHKMGDIKIEIKIIGHDSYEEKTFLFSVDKLHNLNLMSQDFIEEIEKELKAGSADG